MLNNVLIHLWICARSIVCKASASFRQRLDSCAKPQFNLIAFATKFAFASVACYFWMHVGRMSERANL